MASPPVVEALKSRRWRPVCWPDNAVLSIDQVAAGLQIGVRTAERLRLPTIVLGKQTRRYLWRQVVSHLEGLAEWPEQE